MKIYPAKFNTLMVFTQACVLRNMNIHKITCEIQLPTSVYCYNTVNKTIFTACIIFASNLVYEQYSIYHLICIFMKSLTIFPCFYNPKSKYVTFVHNAVNMRIIFSTEPLPYP